MDYETLRVSRRQGFQRARQRRRQGPRTGQPQAAGPLTLARSRSSWPATLYPAHGDALAALGGSLRVKSRRAADDVTEVEDVECQMSWVHSPLLSCAKMDARAHGVHFVRN